MDNDQESTVFSSDNLINVLNEVNTTSFTDQFGPEEVIQLYDPIKNFQAILVLDNTALGPAIGPIKIAKNITPRDIFLSARENSYKAALFEIPFGGAQVGIRANSEIIDKTNYLKSFGKIVAPLVPLKFVPLMDQTFNQNEISNFIEIIGDRKAITGKPETFGGIPYDTGTTGFGIGIAIESSVKGLQEILNLPQNLEDLKIAIDGWNTTSLNFAKVLSSKGAKITAISDKWNTIYNDKGLDSEILKNYIHTNKNTVSLKNYPNSVKMPKENILNIDTDVLILSDTSSIISKDNFNQIKPNLIIEATNDKLDGRIEQKLYDKCKWTIPNTITTAGTIISSYVEYTGKNIPDAFSLIESKIKQITEQIIYLSFRSSLLPRFVAKDIAQDRILEALENRN